MHTAYKKKIAGLKLSAVTLDRVEPILSLLEDHAYKTAEREIALLFVESIKRIKNREITPREADAYFTALGILIVPDDKLKLSKDVQDILFVGELLHDAGTDKELPTEIKEAALEVLTVLLGSIPKRKNAHAKARIPAHAR